MKIRVICGVMLLMNFVSYGDSHTCMHHLSSAWYPTQSVQLRTKLANLYEQARQNYGVNLGGGVIRAVIVPHAGYSYSGEVAASVYRLLQKTAIKRVIILGPSHTILFVGVAVPMCTEFMTPLGALPVDTTALAKLADNPLFSHNNDIFYQEHSVEVELPFIAYSLPAVKIVPLVVGTLSYEQIRKVAHSLASIIDEATLLVVSSDFVHYGQRFGYEPFKGITVGLADYIRKLDSDALVLIQQYQVQQFMKFIDTTHATICGAMPIALMLALIKANVFGQVIPHLVSYASSADKGDDATGRVSYVGLVIASKSSTDTAIPLTEYEKRSLLQSARALLEQAFDHTIARDVLYPIITPSLQAHQGVFVTLRKHGQLRGCIGTFAVDKPLYKTVADMTLATAFHDTRFTPLTRKELNECTITISVLTNPVPIASYSAIVLGKHGIILHHGIKQAVFLPEVPGEFGWDLPATLSELSIKAGLAPQAWRDKEARFEVFETIEWNEL